VRRRVGVAAVAVLASAAPASAAETGAYPWDRRAESAGDYAKHRAGRVSFAVVSPDGRVRGYKIHARYRSASVVKAMLLVAYLNEPGVRTESLNSREKGVLRPMIVRSDNGAASRIRNVVGNDGLAKLARRAKMKDFAPSPSWGNTQISAYDQARFFRRIDAFVPMRHRRYARSLLAGVIAPQRWGMPPALPSGWVIYFKGGWLPPRVVNQSALVERGATRIGISVLTDGDPSFAYGHQTITGVTKRLLARLNDHEV
jgi:beta-lactamase class A